MKLEAGKRYLMRSGMVTGQMRQQLCSEYPFCDDANSWTEDGHYRQNKTESSQDIIEGIAEYGELERLVKAANIWQDDRLKLLAYEGQVEIDYHSTGEWRNWNPSDKTKARYRIKRKQWQPFSVGSGWTVSIKEDGLSIGCVGGLNIRKVLGIFQALLAGGESQTNEIRITRLGIVHEEADGAVLPWEDIEMIVKAITDYQKEGQ